jgi:tripartite-type tricarboxylate transporter receptor subunit TctC
MKRRQIHRAALAVLAGLAGIGNAAAQAASWSPTKPIHLIAGTPGGILDIAARQIADKIAAPLGQAVIVENKSGAGGIVAMEAAARSAPDGHTLVLTTFVEMTVNPWLFEHLPYDPVKDFAPVTMLYAGTILLAAHPSFAADTLADLIRLAKAQPGKFQYGSSGIARPPHIWAERFKLNAGIDIGHVPYNGGAPMVKALLAGEVPLGMEGAPAWCRTSKPAS